MRIVKAAIDEALAKSSEQLLLSLAKLGDRFSLHPASRFPSTRAHVKLSSSSNK
ncbi:hypothetical protein [Herminiimonas fonticola]|uniref:hypothetical protein n=1 Tax=Herminiimonas fonticola TaxID=303380 RepID=UPI003341051E